MLSLTREPGQSVIIGDGTENRIRIMVVTVKGDRVQLGFEAPESIRVDREEVAEARRREAADESSEGSGLSSQRAESGQ